ncbi:MAG: CPBP family intramembrane metalloprotease [Candidatus Riflebacteria bacterium]|nr:CPBP family intramembrane metalloprotease [Candidatus Riflebacteria bacterium]
MDAPAIPSPGADMFDRFISRGDAKTGRTDGALPLRQVTGVLVLGAAACGLTLALFRLWAAIGLTLAGRDTGWPEEVGPLQLMPVLLGLGLAPLAWESLVGRRPLHELGLCLPVGTPGWRPWAESAALGSLFLLYLWLFPPLLGLAAPPDTAGLSLRLVNWLWVAAGEELLFRGIVQGRIAQAWGPLRGWSLSALLFAFPFHWGACLVHQLGVLLPAGLVFGSLRMRHRSLLFPIMLHWWGNVLLA